MAAVRRSTRLSTSSKPLTPSTTTATTTTTRKLTASLSTPRAAAMWRRRQPKNVLGSDDEDAHTDTADTQLLSQEENNENSNLLNTMERANTRKSTSTAVRYCEHAEPKTPRSSKKTAVEPMRAVRKRQLLEKRKADDGMESESSDDDDDQDGAEAHHVSPTKQSRRQPKSLPQHLISPTRLLDRLSIDERSEEVTVRTETEALEKEDVGKEGTPTAPATPRSKYQNARRVLNSAETQHLPGREQQLQELREFFGSHLEQQRSGSLYVSGQPGTGKTACLSLLLRAPEFAQQLKRVYINCTSIASVGAVYKKLCAELELKLSGRTERDHLEAIQRYLRTTKKMLLLVLDEIDQLCSARQAVLYTIFEWPALPGARLLLVGIANSLDLTDRALMRLNARCELKPQLLHFPPYTKQQIVEIFKSRLAEADVLDVFPPVTLQLLAAKVSAVSGDVRRALDIGRRVVEIAEQQKRAGEREVHINSLNIDMPNGTQNAATDMPADTLQPVQVSQVAAVLNKVYGASQNLQEDIEGSFPLQQKLMLCSLLLMLRNERNKDITIGRLHEIYRRVCQKRNINALDQAEFAGAVDLIETRGILRIVRKKEPRLSKVQLQWDEEEVNAALSDKQLIAVILNDKSCLNK